VRDLQSNEVASIRAEHVIVADGKGAVPAGSPIRTGDFGVKAHFMDVDGPRDTIELFGCRGLYGGVAAIEGGRWNVAFSVPAERLQGCAGDVAAVFDGITRENPILRGRMRNARPAGEWLVAPLPRFGVRKSWPAGVIPVGNAAAAIEPIGGEGMGLALRSAELAAASVIEGFDREIATVGGRVPVRRLNGNQVRGAFVSMWRTRAAACRAGAIVTSNPMLARVLVPLLNQRIVSHSMLRLMGKG